MAKPELVILGPDRPGPSPKASSQIRPNECYSICQNPKRPISRSGWQVTILSHVKNSADRPGGGPFKDIASARGTRHLSNLD